MRAKALEGTRKRVVQLAGERLRVNRACEGPEQTVSDECEGKTALILTCTREMAVRRGRGREERWKRVRVLEARAGGRSATAKAASMARTAATKMAAAMKIRGRRRGEGSAVNNVTRSRLSRSARRTS